SLFFNNVYSNMPSHEKPAPRSKPGCGKSSEWLFLFCTLFRVVFQIGDPSAVCHFHLFFLFSLFLFQLLFLQFFQIFISCHRNPSLSFASPFIPSYQVLKLLFFHYFTLLLFLC